MTCELQPHCLFTKCSTLYSGILLKLRARLARNRNIIRSTCTKKKDSPASVSHLQSFLLNYGFNKFSLLSRAFDLSIQTIIIISG